MLILTHKVFAILESYGFGTLYPIWCLHCNAVLTHLHLMFSCRPVCTAGCHEEDSKRSLCSSWARELVATEIRIFSQLQVLEMYSYNH